MKKNLFLMASTMLVLLASCSSEVPCDVNEGHGIVNEGHGIEFRTSVSRAAVTTLNDLNEFDVTAVWNSQLYFDKVTYTKTDGTYKADITYYWPGDNGNVDFYAYAPKGLAGVSFAADGDKKVTKFTPASSFNEQIDFISVKTNGNKETYEGLTLPLNFKHRLSQIEIQAKKTTKDGYTYRIAGVRIGKVCGKADFDFAGEEWTPITDEDGVKTYTSKTFENVVTLNKDPQGLLCVKTTESATSTGANEGSAMLIPQQLTPWVPDYENKVEGKDHKKDPGSYISVLLNITRDKDNWQLYPFTSQKQTTPATVGETSYNFAWAAVPIGTNWEAGKKYLYTLNFDKGAGNVDPDDEDNPDEPILAPITFEVDVIKWDTDAGFNGDLDVETKVNPKTTE